MLGQISSVYIRLYQVWSIYFRLEHFRSGKVILVQVKADYLRVCQVLTSYDM